MTQEEKQLLLKDICGRLPYDVKFQGEDSNVYTLDAANYFALQVEDAVFKPYLRSMSSMTEEERDDVKKHMKREQIVNVAFYHATEKTYDWYNARHFDYRGLIEKGLAIEAPEGMYKTE